MLNVSMLCESFALGVSIMETIKYSIPFHYSQNKLIVSFNIWK